MRFILAGLFCLFSLAAVAQPVSPGCSPSIPNCVGIQGWLPTGTTSFSSSTSSSNIALPLAGNFQNVLVANAGSVNAWVSLGGSSVTATTATPSIMVPAGQSIWLPVTSSTYIAGITGSSTSTLTVTTGFGVPFIVTAGGGSGGGGSGGGTSSTFSAAFPSAGTAIGVKNGTNMVNLTADGSSNLNVNCAVGCSGGTSSNAASGLAISSINGQTLAWMYGFNGTTWDQLQTDGSKNLKVAINGTLPAFTAPPAVAQSGIWTIQPGNTPNTSAWLVTGTGGTFPVTGTFWQATQPVSAASLTVVSLDVKTVTTGGTAVTALAASHRTAGGFLQNPVGATTALCINEIGTASGTSSSGDTTCIAAGTSYNLAPSGNAVSVVSSDSSHPFSGYGLTP